MNRLWSDAETRDRRHSNGLVENVVCMQCPGVQDGEAVFLAIRHVRCREAGDGVGRESGAVPCADKRWWLPWAVATSAWGVDVGVHLWSFCTEVC